MRKTIIVEKDGNQHLIELDRAAFTCYRNLNVHYEQIRNFHKLDPNIPISRLVRGIILPNSHNIHCGTALYGNIINVVYDLQYSPNEVLLDDLPIEDRKAIMSMFNEESLFIFWNNTVFCRPHWINSSRSPEWPFILTEFIQQGYKWIPYIDSNGEKKFSKVITDNYYAPFFLMPNSIIAGNGTSACTLYGYIDISTYHDREKLQTLKSFHK